MTEEQKQASENKYYKTTWGILLTYDYKKAFKRSYESLSEEERIKQTKQLKALPNFDSEIFYQISGIKIEDYENKTTELTLEQIAEKFGISVDSLKIKK